MPVVKYLIELIVSFTYFVVLFFNLNHIKYTFRSVFMVILLRIPVAALFATLNLWLSNNFFSYFDTPFYGLLLSYVFLRPLPKTLLVFYGLLPFVLENLFFRLVSYFILPLFGQTTGNLEDTLIFVIVNLLSLFAVIGFIKWLEYDFVKLRTNKLEENDKRILNWTNWMMIGYYGIMQSLTYLEHELGLSTMALRQLVLVLYLVFFMGVIKQLDMHVRQKLQAQLDFQQALKLKYLEAYSNQVEGLYREVKGFRHDYANLLITLRLAIEDNDLEQVKDIYQSVLKDTHKRLQSSKYEIGRLANIDNAALKSLLAAKFLQANDQNISLVLEVPEVIQPKGILLVDFITVVSILCDNALEAAKDAAIPKINIAFFTEGNKQIFIIENTTQQERVDLTKINSFGHSSKGENRGIGLYNVMKILDNYPYVSIATTSHSHTFCQTIAIQLPQE